MYLSSMLKEHGHKCKLLVGKTLKDFIHEIEIYRPDLIGFSIMTGSHLWAVQIAEEIKGRYNIPSIFGGAHPTYFPEFVNNDSVDIIVRGEGEEALLEVMNAFTDHAPLKNIGNLTYKENGKIIENPIGKLKQNIDEYPFPDRNLYGSLEGRIDRSVRAVLTSRGCPYNCTFCFQAKAREIYKNKGKYVRYRSIDNVLEECKTLKSETDVKRIIIKDDTFGINKEWLYDFLPRYKKEVGLEFMCLLRADIIASDRETAFRLAENGCRTVYWGIESGNEKLRNLILRKKVTDEKIFKAAEYLHKAGIKFLTFNILGLPDETLEDAISTVELNIKIKTDYPWCSLYMPLPGTELTQYSIDKGYLDSQYYDINIQNTFHNMSVMNMKNINEITNLQRFFQTAVLWPKTFPFIKRIIYIKPNPMFNAWFAVVYFYVYWLSEGRKFLQSLVFAIRNYKHVISKKIK